MAEPTRPCPYCGETCYADWVDVGFGPYGVQCGPYYCEACRASEIGPYDKDRDLTPEEKKYGWYKPGAPLGSSVNAIGGLPVAADDALRIYRMEHNLGIQILDPKEFRHEPEKEGDDGPEGTGGAESFDF